MNGPGPPQADVVTYRALAGLVLGRIGVDGGARAVLPFLPVVAAGLGLSFGELALLVALRSAAGLAGPGLARVVHGRSRRSVLVGACLPACLGCLAITGPTADVPAADILFLGSATAVGDGTVHDRTLLAAAGFVATGLARPLFDIAAQSWIAGAVPPGRIGRATGIVELGWALAQAATVPLAGMLIGPFGWRVIGLLTAGYALVGALAVGRLVPRGPVRERTPAPAARPVRARVPALVVAVALTVAAAEWSRWAPPCRRARGPGPSRPWRPGSGSATWAAPCWPPWSTGRAGWPCPGRSRRCSSARPRRCWSGTQSSSAGEALRT
ncbi:MFS transporter [Pseudonocardia xishanensis]|uniref:MFS transporter n=1 Tax=Pseudonocardia xishanensis TaxID=630995 RepID=A0ABP8S445_9PSEU